MAAKKKDTHADESTEEVLPGAEQPEPLPEGAPTAAASTPRGRMLDRNRPFGTISGNGVEGYEQDGLEFDVGGRLVTGVKR